MNEVSCPCCGSHLVIVREKGYNGCLPLALIVGAFFTFGFTLILLLIFMLMGTIGSNKPVFVCCACGHRWEVAKGRNRQEIFKKRFAVFRKTPIGVIIGIVLWITVAVLLGYYSTIIGG